MCQSHLSASTIVLISCHSRKFPRQRSEIATDHTATSHRTQTRSTAFGPPHSGDIPTGVHATSAQRHARQALKNPLRQKKKKREPSCTSSRPSVNRRKAWHEGARHNAVDRKTNASNVRGDAQSWHLKCVKAESHGDTHAYILLDHVQAPTNIWARGRAGTVGVVLEHSKNESACSKRRTQENCIWTAKMNVSLRNGVKVPLEKLVYTGTRSEPVVGYTAQWELAQVNFSPEAR